MYKVITSVGVLVTIGLLVWILIKQHDCCKNESYNTAGVGSSMKSLCKYPCKHNSQGLCVDAQGDYCASSIMIDGREVGNLCGQGKYSTISFNCKPIQM